MATVKDQMSRTLLGTVEEPLSLQQSRANFLKFATKDEETGEYYLSEQNFVDAIAPEGEDYHKIKRDQYAILFRVADSEERGRVTLHDWVTFENLLAKPDAEYEIAFRLFDVKGTGIVSFEDFQTIYNARKGENSIPFDWNSGWATLYLGGKKNRHTMTYHQFAQMMRGMQGERIRQAFHHFDKNNDGYIEPRDFGTIIVETAGHKLSDHLLDHIQTLCNVGPGVKISYANVRAFQNVLREMDVVEMVVQSATSNSEDGKITRTDFLNEAARITRCTMFTPMEADILFHFASLDEPTGRLGLGDFSKVLDSSWKNYYDVEAAENMSFTHQSAAMKFATTEHYLHDLAHSVYHFALGGMAGMFGAFMVYPIDLVKTRLQNQRSQYGQRLYKNSIDCFQKVWRHEGVRGLYSGVIPQLLGVAPEKAIKLTVHDLVRGKLTDPKTAHITLPSEILAGGCAGACQVIFTNPLEIVKIRMQMQGEMRKNHPEIPQRSAMWMVRNLGLLGLYKAAHACMMRDITFCAIYFPTYHHLKRDLFGEGPNKKLGVLQLFTAGGLAGIPAVYLTTPCDVIKTRLQVEPRPGEQAYTGIINCAKNIYRQEGFKAFWKGGPARIVRSSPQFAFTLAMYEVLQGIIPMPGGLGEPESARKATETGSGSRETKAPQPYLRSRNALKIILDLDQNFGKPRLPQHANRWPKFVWPFANS